MSVAWSTQALADRRNYLEAAFDHALEKQDPQIYSAAATRDERIEVEGNKLDGAATYAEGPLPGTRIYSCRVGKHLLIYTRESDDVEILWVAPSRSNWHDSGQ